MLVTSREMQVKQFLFSNKSHLQKVRRVILKIKKGRRIKAGEQLGAHDNLRWNLQKVRGTDVHQRGSMNVI